MPRSTLIDPSGAESVTQIERAISIALQAHAGQTDKGGAPYILHPLRLLYRMETEEEMVAAVLHDVIEDTAIDCEQLASEGFTAGVLAALECLTRREAESYDAYIDRVASNQLARRVKLADLEDNLDIKRLGTLGSSEVDRLGKYHKAWHRLRPS